RRAGDLDAVSAVARDDVGADEDVAAGGGDQHAVLAVAEVGVGAERGEAAERVVGDEAAGGVADDEAVLAVGGVDVAQRDRPAHQRAGGRALDDDAVEGVAQGGVVVGPEAEEVGLDGGAVGVGDAQAVAAVAAYHVVEDERILL